MKNTIYYFTALLFIVFLSACQSEEEKAYDEIKNMYLNFMESDSKYTTLVFDKEKLDGIINNYITEFPNSDHTTELRSFKTNLPNIIYPKAVAEANKKANKFYQKKFYDYDTYKKQLKTVINFVNKIRTDFPNRTTSNLEQIYKKLTVINNNILIEETEFINIKRRYKPRYTNSEADEEIENINNFLSRYPETIKKLELDNRKMNLEYVKFKNDAKRSPANIVELNNLIDKIKEYPAKINPTCSECFDKIQLRIKELENKREDIYQMEYQNKITILFNKMENEAIGIARKRHDICGFASDSYSTIKNKESYGTKEIYRYEYIFRMKGGFFCNSRYKTKAKITGVIEGNKDKGVTYYIDSANLIGDSKLY